MNRFQRNVSTNRVFQIFRPDFKYCALGPRSEILQHRWFLGSSRLWRKGHYGFTGEAYLCQVCAQFHNVSLLHDVGYDQFLNSSRLPTPNDTVTTFCILSLQDRQKMKLSQLTFSRMAPLARLDTIISKTIWWKTHCIRTIPT